MSLDNESEYDCWTCGVRGRLVEEVTATESIYRCPVCSYQWSVFTPVRRKRKKP